MKDYSNKYNYYIHGNEVIAVSTYAGKTVRGKAKCDPTDEFSNETGKKLAAARCNERVASKRRARATKKVKEAREQLAYAQQYLAKMTDYYNDSVDAEKAAQAAVRDILTDL